MTVLVIEDDTHLLGTLSYILEDEGYEVLCATNGQEALRLLNQSPTRVNSIIMDLVMPHMDGWTLIAKIKESPTFSTIPIIVLSEADVVPPGVFAAFQKPTNLDTLLSALRCSNITSSQ